MSASVVVQGGSVLFSCSGFAPNSDVDIDDNGAPATLAARRFGGAAGLLAARPLAVTVLNAPANSDGTILVRVAFAKNAALGAHVLTATGVDTDGNAKVGSSVVTVVPAPQAAACPRPAATAPCRPWRSASAWSWPAPASSSPPAATGWSAPQLKAGHGRPRGVGAPLAEEARRGIPRRGL